MLHSVDLDDKQLAHMCYAYEVNMSEVVANDEDRLAYYGNVQGPIPMEWFRMASKECHNNATEIL